MPDYAAERLEALGMMVANLKDTYAPRALPQQRTITYSSTAVQNEKIACLIIRASFPREYRYTPSPATS